LSARRALVFCERPGDRHRAGRTLRALRKAGFDVEAELRRAPEALAAKLRDDAVWLVRSGAWPAHFRALPPASATGRPLCAVGAMLAEPAGDESGDSRAWKRALEKTGGDLESLAGAEDGFPPLASAALEPPLPGLLRERLRAGVPLQAALIRLLASAGARVVRVAALDVHDDARLRVAQIVTSLQQGGAERIARDLALALPRLGTATRLVTLGTPTRAAFPPPPATLDVSRCASRAERVSRLEHELVSEFAVDLVHGHLLDRPDVLALAAAGLPLLLTIHNVAPLWPEGTRELRSGEAVLLVGCSRAVEADLRAAGSSVPLRTVWNGIDPSRFEPRHALELGAEEWRRRLELPGAATLLIAIANPRPHKRLDRLPAILAATRRLRRERGSPDDVHLAIAGGVSVASDSAAEAVRALHRQIEALRLDDRVHLVGSLDEPAPLLAAADAFVSASEQEGLSLAQLEALAARVPVVTTAAGGAGELARLHAGVEVLPVNAGDDAFASALVSALESRDGDLALAPHFESTTMARSYARLYPRAIEAARGRRPGEGLLLVTNNFSTGGAQTSARRLLLALQQAGLRVRAAVLQEQPDWPTPGRRALQAAGVPVCVLPRAGAADAAVGVAALLDQIDEDPPAAVLLWNVIPEHKLLLVDALLDVPVFDVSPGAMYFESLDRYFGRPRVGLPYLGARDYGERLAGVIVKYAGERARAACLGAPVHVIPNGVPVASARERASGTAGPLLIGTLARIHPQKRLEDLLDALRCASPRLPPHVLRIAGGVDGGCDEYAAELRRRADGLSVEWLGDLAEPGEFLEGLDVFALVAEPAGCPNASLEAMARGLPVVVTDVGGAAEQVEDGVNGRLVPPRNTAAFAQALCALASDDGLRERFSRASRERVAARFSLDRMASEYRRVCLGG
jgi:glycosyltransferase involved in cell wall biosynthesis